ncbi:hypothetical protein RIF29_25106 [Crotalaria pallida]|uniref:Uncharacterized protein n=1 Tax=Crotalaria pallida TaxID=3830 RepID=A0AAN9ELR6_CROPI
MLNGQNIADTIPVELVGGSTSKSSPLFMCKDDFKSYVAPKLSSSISSVAFVNMFHSSSVFAGDEKKIPIDIDLNLTPPPSIDINLNLTPSPANTDEEWNILSNATDEIEEDNVGATYDLESSLHMNNGDDYEVEPPTNSTGIWILA